MNFNFNEKLLAYGYFFKEIPPEFHSESLAKAVTKINFDSFTKSEKNIWTKPVHYSVPKKDNFRRIKTIPAPIHQIQLCKLLSDNWIHLENHFNDSKISMSIPKISSNNNKATEHKIAISEKMHIRMNHLHNKNYILQTDISRYFNTIYTHVIPWALHTKEFAKAKIGKPILGNRIDKIIQNMQDGQTFGIPMGPETSQIVSEIIGVAIDRDFRNQIGLDVPGFRFTDDIEYYFDNEDTAKKALVKLHKIVNDYQLDLNPSKTRILKAPIDFESEWHQYFTRFKFRNTILGQRSDINTFFSKAFKYKSITDDKGILSYALKVIRTEVIHKENWSIFESLLLHSGFSDANCLPLVLEIIEGYYIKGYELNLGKLKEFIEELIENNIVHNNHYEVVWALVFSKRLNIKLSQSLNFQLSESDNSIICILTMILKTKGLLEGFFDTQKYKGYLNSEGLYGPQWLFAYESYKQGWLKPYTDPEYVTNDKFFKILYDNDVSFLRTELDLLKLKEEIMDRNVILVNSGTTEGQNETTVEETEDESIREEGETESPESESGVEEGETESPGSESGVEEGETEPPESESGVEEGETEPPESESGVEEETEPPESESGVEEGEPVPPESESEVEEVEPEPPGSESGVEEGEPDSINKILEDSIYRNNEWLITLLNTDLENSDKIKYNKIEREY
ncbi:RNA-directed DNA polymerase [uncultured Psychrobacillus sp.]|uniref:RNA-directed DNA polymerase n=1 Tax=uncultured Psychrobacillus sp. TaxID=1551585 RepID=UPI002635DB49|nr:RNA-directed DNA polymerase [uncultured Psychrobacillus sp.]